MAAKSSEMPDTTEDLVELSNYVTECRDSTLSKIKAQLRTVCDYIMFLFEYTEFDGKYYNKQQLVLYQDISLKTFIDNDITLSSRVLRWPQEIEQFLVLATSRVIQKKGVVEGQLKTKKTEFESEYATRLFTYYFVLI